MGNDGGVKKISFRELALVGKETRVLWYCSFQAASGNKQMLLDVGLALA